MKNNRGGSRGRHKEPSQGDAGLTLRKREQVGRRMG